MKTSYNVRIWAVETRKRKTLTRYRVTWRVAGRGTPFRETFVNKEQAKSFHAKLTTAAKSGEAFRANDGLPVSMAREVSTESCLEFAKQYIDFRWPEVSPGHRRNIVDAMVTVVSAMVTTDRGRPSPKSLRSSLRVLLNPRTRGAEMSAEAFSVVRWVERNSEPVSALGEHDGLQKAVAALGKRLDGGPAAEPTRRRKRATLTHALDYAVTKNMLGKNPLQEFTQVGKPPSKGMKQVDKRTVVNPVQARTLLRSLHDLGNHGQRLVAFFGCMYFAGLRPEEVVNLRSSDLALPASGWGEIHLRASIPEQSAAWTDSGDRIEEQPLKHRTRGDGRTVPSPPELTALLRWHLDTFAPTGDGRLFYGARSGGRVSSASYGKVWDQARYAAFTQEAYASPLARKPYSLRHACVSTWLAAGVEPSKVAEWAGHSVAVLLNVYAKCLDGGATAARDRIEALLSPAPRSGGARGE